MKTPDMCKLTQFNVDFVCVCVLSCIVRDPPHLYAE